MGFEVRKEFCEIHVSTTKHRALGDDEIALAATHIGYGAVKYFDLRQNPATEYIFSYERMLDTRGNTAVYLLFAYARIQSILHKAREAMGGELNLAASVTLNHESERHLAYTLMLFEETISQFRSHLIPTRLCDLLYAISVRFSDFVTNCRVLGSPEQESRLAICVATRNIMKCLFELLGITPVDQI